MALTGKICAPCTLCCKVMEIEELSKPVGTWCSHCKPGTGCTIYSSHPQSCQDFTCQWLMEQSMPDEFRPDRARVVLVAEGDGPRLIAHCDPSNPTAWQREPMYSLLKEQARATWGTNATVLAKAGNRLWLIAPREDVDLGHVDPRSPFQIKELKDGRVQVTVLPPIREGEDVQTRLAELRNGLRSGMRKSRSGT